MYSDITYSGGKHETTKQTNTNVLKPHTRAMYFTTIALFSGLRLVAASAEESGCSKFLALAAARTALNRCKTFNITNKFHNTRKMMGIKINNKAAIFVLS